jgi:hypothetical protein
MAKQVVDVGSKANDGSGDSLREAGIKINANFTEIYTALGGVSGNVSVVSKLTGANGMIVSNPTGDITLTNRIATTTQLGVFKVGNNLSINSEGVLSANAGAYSLPTATGSVLGGVKVGSGLSIANGVLSADVQSTQTPQLVNGDFTVALGTTGALSYPNNAVQRDTATVICAGNASTVVYTASGQYQHTIKLLIQVEGFEGAEEVFDTQACEMIIAKSFRANDIASTVYGIVHTSVVPLATFTAEWNALTNRVEVLCTTPSANTVNVRIFATEITTSD